MKILKTQKSAKAFTLMETVIAIGVLALLLTGFLAVFAPASAGIRKAISAQDANRLAFALEKELVSLRNPSPSGPATGFDKAYTWIEESTGGTSDKPTFTDRAILVYQYRGQLNDFRNDGTREPFIGGEGVAGEDFIVQPIARRRDDPLIEDDLEALVGRVYGCKLIPLVRNNGELRRGNPGRIEPPSTGPEDFSEAVIPFASEFHLLPSTAIDYIRTRMDDSRLNEPLFVRNMAVRR